MVVKRTIRKPPGMTRDQWIEVVIKFNGEFEERIRREASQVGSMIPYIEQEVMEEGNAEGPFKKHRLGKPYLGWETDPATPREEPTMLERLESAKKELIVSLDIFGKVLSLLLERAIAEERLVEEIVNDVRETLSDGTKQTEKERGR